MAQAEKIYSVSLKGKAKIRKILEGNTSDIRRYYASTAPFLQAEDFVETGISCVLPDMTFTSKKTKAKDDEKNTISLHTALVPFRVRGSIMFPERASAQGSRFVSVGPLALPTGHMPRGWSDLLGVAKTQ